MGLGGRPEIKTKHPDGSQDGKFKVPTLRNIDLRAPYGHNGVFVTLEQIVHFYNTRDVLGTVRRVKRALARDSLPPTNPLRFSRRPSLPSSAVHSTRPGG